MSNEEEKNVIWITGGGTGIGRALALESAQQGKRVAISGRREDKLNSVLDEVRSNFGTQTTCISVACDVTDEHSLISAAQRIVDTFGRIDTVVANAGFSVSGQTTSVTTEEWRLQFEVNVFGAVSTFRAAWDEVLRNKGRFVLVGSAAAFINTPTNGPYCASKAALHAIGNSLSLELEGSGATCTIIHPGFVESEIGQVDNTGQFQEKWEDRRPQWLMWTAEDAAKSMMRAIDRRKRVKTITFHAWFGVLLSRLSPTAVRWIIKLFSRSVSRDY